jgi:hypothetical protein
LNLSGQQMVLALEVLDVLSLTVPGVVEFLKRGHRTDPLIG